MSLCRVFGEDGHDFMPIKFMYMMVQISFFGDSIIFYFASFLAKEIHVVLIGIAKGKIEEPLVGTQC